ncbi:MAG: Rab family GTPase [Methanobacteriota archaeon]
MGQPDLKRKIVLLGDSAVGKTSLIRRFVLDSFDDSYITTIGTKITKKETVVKGSKGQISMSMMIWDILGQQGYTGTQSKSYLGTQGAIFVFDLTRKETLASIEKYWRPELAKVAGNVPSVLVGNKVDLLGERQVSDEEINRLAGTMHAQHYLSSAKTGENVEGLFSNIAEMAASLDAMPKGSEAVAKKEAHNLTDVADMMIIDFTESFGDPELAMAMVRTQFSKAGLDISNPTKAGLHEAVRLLAEAEQNFKSPEEISRNLVRRKALIDKCP